jgi:glycosyltransferase involved in cell wall biosynthesis
MKNKKNLLIVSPSKAGLTETFIKAHIERLHANVYYLYGYDLDFKDQNDINLSTIYAPKPSFGAKLINFLPHYIYFRINKNRQKKRTRKALINQYLKENQIDAVLAEYGTSGSFIAPVCKALNIPLVVHFHGFDASVYKVLEEFKDGYRFMYDYASKIIVVSNAMKQALMNHGCEASKLILNTYGPHPDYMNVVIDYNSNSIVSVGRHTYKKAPYLTILAFQKVLVKHPNLKLVMVGTGEIFEVSKHMVESLGLQEKIILPGGLPREDIIKYLEQSFLFVQHSLVANNGDSEGTPVGIIEAMAAGLPVVSTRHAGIPDVVVEDETGFLVEEGDVDAMAEHILTLVNNRDLAKTFGKKGKAVIQENFTLEKHIDTINKVIANAS